MAAGGVPVLGYRPASGLGRTQSLAAALVAELQPADCAHRRRAGLRSIPPRSGSAARAPGRVRDPDLGHLRGARPVRRPMLERSRSIPDSQTSIPIWNSTSPSCDRHRPRPGRRSRPRRLGGRPHARDHAGRTPGDPLRARRRAVRRVRAARDRGPLLARDPVDASSCARRPARWSSCRTSSRSRKPWRRRN